MRRNILNNIELTKDTHLYPSNPYYHKQEPDYETPNYTDKVFPPNDNSIIFIDPTKVGTGQITEEDIKSLKGLGLVWKRPAQIFGEGKYKIFEKLDIEDIHQGLLGNCYFLSSLSAIAEYPGRLERLIQTKQISQNGCYALKIYIQGKPKIVVIDDFMPTANIKTIFAFASSGPGEIWVQLFEKAWAKINKSFSMTIAGLPSEALSSLTEAPVITYVHRKYEPDELWRILKRCDDKQYIICTNTNDTTANESVGLVPSHAYTIISVYEVDGYRLMKLRNPWGEGEWNGAFGDKSELWTPQLKKKLKYTDSNDGIFYMLFNDFLIHYPYTFVCKYYDGSSYVYSKVKMHSDEQMVGVRFRIDKKTKAIIGLHQKQERFYTKVKNYKTCYAKFFLVKERGYEYICSNEGTLDKIYLELKKPLDEGDYYILGKVKWRYFNEAPCNFVISCYSDNEKIKFYPLDKQAIKSDYLTRIIDSYISKKCKYQLTSTDRPDGLSFVSSLIDTDTGFFWLSFKNNSKDEGCKVMFAANMNEHVSLLSKEIETKTVNNQTIYTIKVPPQSQELVVFEQLDNVWNCKVNFSELRVSWDEYNPDNDIKYICKNVGKSSKFFETIVENELYYYTLVKDNSVLVVIGNNSQYDYVISASLKDTVNCYLFYPLSANFEIVKKSFKFLKIVPETLDKINFTFVCSYKCSKAKDN